MSVDGSDLSPAQAARTSYRDFVDEHTSEENENLVDYLIRHNHSSPIEFAGATFYMVMPIFVARQLVRHRTAVINEESLRYVEPRKDFYIPAPEECKLQSTSSKQGASQTLVDDPDAVINNVAVAGALSQAYYEYLAKTGLAKELCRTVLPLGQYTAWYWKANLRNIFHMLQLRLDSHAQAQIQVYAQAMLEQLEPYFPKTIEAWKLHVLNAVTFSADEWAAIASTLTSEEYEYILEIAEKRGMRKTRLKEFEAKLNN